MEKNDYFGVAVQTTARICAEAGSEEIWISHDFWQSCPTYTDYFRYKGDFALKGLSKEEMLYEVNRDPIPGRPTGKGKVAHSEIGAR